MNMQDKIEQCLRAAPKFPAPDGLLDRLRADIAVRQADTHVGVVRRWFAPTGGAISRWRVAAAIAVMVLLPLSYGATKLVRRFFAISQLSAIKVDLPFGGALSPDGKHFAGTTWDYELFVIDTSTGQQRKLAENCSGPSVWSADGSEIAFVSSSGEKRTLLALSLKTGKTRSLMEDPPWLEDWSPDGKLILGEGMPKPGVRSAVMVNLESKEKTVLAEDTGDSPSPRFSPNADCLSYVTKEANRSILHLRTVDGTNHAQYSDFPGEISQPMWSPDGAYVVFTGTQTGLDQQYKDLWALRVEGNRFVGRASPVVPDVGKMQFYNWSRNGQLAYRKGFELGGIFTLPVDLQTGKATGAPRQLTRVGGIRQCYCWSPDGKQIAVWQQDELELSFVSASSGEKMRSLSVAEIEGSGRGMSWSPDGRLIARGCIDKQKRGGLFLITVQTGDIKLLVSLKEGWAVQNPTWSPDGKTIACFNGYDGDVYVVNVEDGKPRRLTSPTEPNEGKRTQFFIRPVFAPDGRSVAYIDGRRILATTIDGQETREILNFKDPINVFDWSPDGRYIVFTPGNKEIWCAATDGGEPFRIADISNLGEGKGVFAWWPEWSPKGDEIIFRVVREEYQYWVMENFLPAAEAGGR
jgi:Tol biopolymer transport system component